MSAILLHRLDPYASDFLIPIQLGIGVFRFGVRWEMCADAGGVEDYVASLGNGNCWRLAKLISLCIRTNLVTGFSCSNTAPKAVGVSR